MPVDPAWVVCTPPNYGPDFKSIVTLYDLLTETMIAAGFAQAPDRPVFERDILPLLERTSALQWLNFGFLNQFADSGPQDYLRPELLARLGSPAEENEELRRQVFNAFRNPAYDSRQRLALPWIYGDGMELPASNDRQWMAIPPHLYKMLRQWAEGDFDPAESASPLSEPEALDRAALDFCLADAFHPGCEVTWPIRHSSMYMGRFRLLHRSPEDPEPDYSDTLEPAQVYNAGWSRSTTIYGAGTPGGPLWGQRAGDLTRWMAVPWQADTASCRDGYDSGYDEYVPTFWPARVPNQVLSQADYERVMDSSLQAEQRIAAFRSREEWLRFGDLGVVVERAGPTDARELGLPSTFYVEELAGGAAEALAPGASEAVRRTKLELRTSHKAAAQARGRHRSQ